MLEVAIKVSLVLAATLALAAALSAASAAWRHRVLAVGLAAALALPLLGALLPRWSVPEPLALEVAPPEVLPDAAAVGTTPAAALASPSAPGLAAAASELDPRAVLAALWALGSAFFLARLFGAHRAARRLARRGVEVCRLAPREAHEQSRPADPVAVTAADAYAALDGRWRIAVGIAPVAGPLTLGVLRPRVLLPESATRWSGERLRLTLLHELAHAERADVAWLLLAQLVRALFWWNPLAWLAARWLRREAELAADDRVLETGARASAYAEVLLCAATVARMPAVAMGMARRSEVERRIGGVLGHARRSAPRLAGRILTLITAMSFAGAVACTGSQSAAPRTPDGAGGASADAIAGEVLATLVEERAPRSARVLVLDVASGRVLGMAAHGGDARREMVRAIETGSTVKPLMVALALEQGLDPEQTFFLEHGAWELDGRVMRDWSDHGSLDVTGVLVRSSNIGAAKIYLTLGAERTRAGLTHLGLGRGPTLGIEDAERGALPAMDAWRGFDGAAYAVGATLRATPLELASAYAAIANDGVRVEPTLDGSGASERVLSAATAARIREMLVHAVEDEDGTGRNARVSGLRVAGKTGSAEIEGGGARALFIGMLPADAPRYVVYVDAEAEARTGWTGGNVAAPVFARVASRLAR